MKKVLIHILFLVSFFSYACSDNDPLSSEDQNNAFYFNSFESDKDTSGWIGVSKNMLTDDSCPAGGKRSLHIGGGCIQPAASIEFSSVKEGNYKISFWAKTGQPHQSAIIKLKVSDNADESKNLVVAVDTTSWKFYQSEGSLYVPGNKKMTMEVWVGGIIYADVYLDNLKIERTTPFSFTGKIYKNVIGMFK